jgi:hypothetical protein
MEQEKALRGKQEVQLSPLRNRFFSFWNGPPISHAGMRTSSTSLPF